MINTTLFFIVLVQGLTKQLFIFVYEGLRKNAGEVHSILIESAPLRDQLWRINGKSLLLGCQRLLIQGSIGAHTEWDIWDLCKRRAGSAAV